MLQGALPSVKLPDVREFLKGFHPRESLAH